MKLLTFATTPSKTTTPVRRRPVTVTYRSQPARKFTEYAAKYMNTHVYRGGTGNYDA